MGPGRQNLGCGSGVSCRCPHVFGRMVGGPGVEVGNGGLEREAAQGVDAVHGEIEQVIVQFIEGVGHAQQFGDAVAVGLPFAGAVEVHGDVDHGLDALLFAITEGRGHEKASRRMPL